MKIGFDRVYCISYCRNIEKQNNIRKVMKYLGINFEFIYGADYTNLEILKDYKKFVGDWKTCRSWKYFTHYIGASYDHYTAVINAYESGANSVLIMEDDATFINDVSYINYVLLNYPKHADIIKFGYLFTKEVREKNMFNFNIKNQYILEDNKSDNKLIFGGSQLYGICNRKTMEKYIDFQQNNFTVCDCVYNVITDKCYALIKPIALDKSAIKYCEEDKNDNYTLLEHIN